VTQYLEWGFFLDKYQCFTLIVITVALWFNEALLNHLNVNMEGSGCKQMWFENHPDENKLERQQQSPTTEEVKPKE